MKILYTDKIQSPIGAVRIAVDGDRLCYCDFAENVQRMQRLLGRRYAQYRLSKSDNPAGISEKLRRYFVGDTNAPADIELTMGGTEFQHSVWQALRQIPCGAAISYSRLARNIGKPKAVRAVASANAQNPVSIIVPCHRVIGRNGQMRGYAGGEDRKIWLLRHEGAII